MAAGSDPKQSAPSLAERWRALAPGKQPPARRLSRPPPAPSTPPPEAVAPPPAVASPSADPAADPALILHAIEAAIAAAAPSGDRAALARVALVSLEPIREALGVPPAARDPVAIVAAFDQVEDLLEALLLAPAPAAASEG